MSTHSQAANFPMQRETDNEQRDLSLSIELQKMWRYRWLALAVAVIFSILGWMVVYMLPNTYQAKARIYLDTQSMLGPLLKGLAVENDLRQVEIAEMTRRTLLRRPNLEKVARDTDKDLLAKTPQDLERVLQRLADSIDIKGGRRDSIFVITCVDKDPHVAKKVVETLLSIFVESTLSSMRRDSGRTESFLDDQIVEYRARLEAAENRLKEFKQKNVGMMPTEAGGYFARLQSEKDRLEHARLELREAKKKQDALEGQLANAVPPVQVAGQMGMVSNSDESILDRISKLETQLDNLRLKYTDHHPDVLFLENSIEDLKKKLSNQGAMSSPSKSKSGDEPMLSRAYQELKVAASEAEAEVSALKVRVQEYEKRVNDLHEKMAVIPDVEAELTRLTRDYDINKSNYESLVARRESAAISRDAEQSVDSVQFRIIDPPIAPALPTGPNRPLLITLVLLLGLGAGGGLAWFKSQLQGTISTIRELSTFTGGEVLGFVSTVAFAGGGRIASKASLVVFIAAVGGLLVVYTVLMLMDLLHLGSPMDAIRLLSGAGA
ncbi:MAG: chain-length determining protein [Gammaproteobacteria bacterium]|nr:chain-length determining protein [Gammaproteobacteria bacterium]